MKDFEYYLEQVKSYNEMDLKFVLHDFSIRDNHTEERVKIDIGGTYYSVEEVMDAYRTALRDAINSSSLESFIKLKNDPNAFEDSVEAFAIEMKKKENYANMMDRILDIKARAEQNGKLHYDINIK